MERFNKFLVLLVITILPLILLQCTQYNEETPFFNGLFLEYDVGSGYKLIYNIYVLDNNKYKIIETDETGILGKEVEELLVNSFGKVYESSKKSYKGKFSPIWIPVHEIEIGDTIDGRHIAIKKDKWEKWDVMVLKDIAAEAESYYDLNTGYWVGSFAKTAVGVGKIILINTNADIPTVAE